MNHERILSCINVMSDVIRENLTVDNPSVQRALLAYDCVYEEIIHSLSHLEPVKVFDSLPPMYLCRECKRN